MTRAYLAFTEKGLALAQNWPNLFREASPAVDTAASLLQTGRRRNFPGRMR